MLNKFKYAQDILSLVSKIAKQQHVDAFEINIVINNINIISVLNLKPDNISFNSSQCLNVKFYHKGSVGCASTTNFDFASLKSVVEYALLSVQTTEKDVFSGIVDKNLLCIPKQLNYIYNPIHNFNINSFINILKKCELYGINTKDIYKSDGSNLYIVDTIKGMTNSHGFFNVFKETKYDLYISFVAKDDHGMQQDYAYFSSYDFKLLPNVEIISNLAIKRTLLKKNPQKIKSKKMSILLESRIAHVFWNVFLQAINGDNQYNKSTFLLNKLNHLIMNQNISIFENPNVFDAIASRPYDSEGVNLEKNFIVVNGYLVRYVLNSYNARQLQMKTTGNSGGCSNIFIESKYHATKDYLIGSIKQGILVSDMMGDGSNIVTGDYSQAANGYYIEDGKLKYPLDNFVIVSNLLDMLKNILCIAFDDVNKNFCIQTGSVMIDNCFISCQ